MNNTFKKVVVKMTDSCLSFVLKRLGVEKYFDGVEGSDFVKNFTLREFEGFLNIDKGDIIVCKRKDVFRSIPTIIDESGRTFLNKRNVSYHFMLFEGDFVSDYGHDGITTYDLGFFDFDKSKTTYLVIKHDDILKYINGV